MHHRFFALLSGLMFLLSNHAFANTKNPVPHVIILACSIEYNQDEVIVMDVLTSSSNNKDVEITNNCAESLANALAAGYTLNQTLGGNQSATQYLLIKKVFAQQ